MQTLSGWNKAEEMENFHPQSHEGPHVRHHPLHVHFALSPSGWLFWFDGCNPIRCASIHGCWMSLSLYSRSVGLKETGRLSRVVFLPSPFKSTLQRAPLRPLMHPVHLAQQSCETQDHRHGQKQFHPLIEPISTSHFEEKQQSDMCYWAYNIKMKHFIKVSIKYVHTLVITPNISVCTTSEMFSIITDSSYPLLNLITYSYEVDKPSSTREKTNFSLLRGCCVGVRVAPSTRRRGGFYVKPDPVSSDGQCMAGCPALAQANGLAGSERHDCPLCAATAERVWR